MLSHQENVDHLFSQITLCLDDFAKIWELSLHSVSRWNELTQQRRKIKLLLPYFISLTFTFSAPPSIISFSLTVTVSPLKCCLARKILPACRLSLSLIQTWMKSERVFLLTSGGLVRSFTIYGWEWKPYGSVLRGLCSYLNILDSNLEYRNSLLSFSRNPTCLREHTRSSVMLGQGLQALSKTQAQENCWRDVHYCDWLPKSKMNKPRKHGMNNKNKKPLLDSHHHPNK